MNNYAFVIKAKAKSDKKSLFCWFSAKSDSRAEREIANILEDAEIETGRGTDYLLPVRTNWHVVDDLPDEGVIDDTWCDRYELSEDSLTWKRIPAPPPSVNIHDDHATVAAAQVEHSGAQLAQDTEQTGTQSEPQQDSAVTFEQATFTQRVLGAWLYSKFTALGPQGLRDIATLQHDMDAAYPQNLLLALNNAKDLLQLKHCFPKTLFDLIRDIKSVWPVDDKAPDVGHLLTFAKEWINAHNNQSESSNGPLREDITAKWVAKQGIKRTNAGTNAGGNNQTDRGNDITHSLDLLNKEIAMATLPMDFDIYEIPGPILRRAKEIIANKEEPFNTWSQKLLNMPGILDFSRAAIFALIRNAIPDITKMPASMQPYINSSLTESNHAHPSLELLTLARHLPAITEPGNTTETNNGTDSTLENTKLGSTDAQPEMKNLGCGMFSIDGLSQKATSNEGEKPENHSEEVGDVQMETNVGQSSEAVTSLPPATSEHGTVEEAAANLANAMKRCTDAIPSVQKIEPRNISENIPARTDSEHVEKLEARIARLEGVLASFAAAFTTAEDTL